MIHALNEFDLWLQKHDLTIDLITIWLVVISAFVIAGGLLTAWWELRGTHDKTDVGRTLKWQKASLSVALAANGIYWSVVLAAFYIGYRIGVLEKLMLRLTFAGGMLIGAVCVALFVRALRRESNGWETKDARDERQDARAEQQDEQQLVLDQTNLVLAERHSTFSKLGVKLDEKIDRIDVINQAQYQREHDVTDREDAVTKREGESS